MNEKKKAKRSFWRFGGRLDSIYNWLVGLFFVLSCFVQIPRYRGHPEAALGYAVGQTFWVAVVLFVLFKVIARGQHHSTRALKTSCRDKIRSVRANEDYYFF